jgi:hypothetical protein
MGVCVCVYPNYFETNNKYNDFSSFTQLLALGF